MLNHVSKNFFLALFLLLGTDSAIGAQETLNVAEASRFVVIGSGETFSFRNEFAQKIDVQSKARRDENENSPIRGIIYVERTYYGEGENTLLIDYEGKVYVLKKVYKYGRILGETRVEAEAALDKALKGLFAPETKALTYMQKNMTLVDDTAKVIVDERKRFFLADQEGAFPDGFSFRYALELEVKGSSVIGYKFIRQGAEGVRE